MTEKVHSIEYVITTLQLSDMTQGKMTDLRENLLSYPSQFSDISLQRLCYFV